MKSKAQEIAFESFGPIEQFRHPGCCCAAIDPSDTPCLTCDVYAWGVSYRGALDSIPEDRSR